MLPHLTERVLFFSDDETPSTSGVKNKMKNKEGGVKRKKLAIGGAFMARKKAKLDSEEKDEVHVQGEKKKKKKKKLQAAEAEATPEVVPEKVPENAEETPKKPKKKKKKLMLEQTPGTEKKKV